MQNAHGLILDWLVQARPTKRQIKLFVLAFALIMVLGSITAMAANAASPLPCAADDSCGDSQVMQPGELIPIGDKSAGGQKNLFESYDFGTWQLDSELSMPGDIVQIAFYGITQLLMYLLLLIVYMTVGLSWWLFSAMSVPGLSDAANTLISSASGSLLEWLFPTAVAVGGCVAYVQGKQAKGSYGNQIAWMVAAGVLAVGLTTQAAVFTHGIQAVRETGSNLILSSTGDAISANESAPISWPTVDYSVNTSEDAMLRKSADSMWRTLVATPWCIADLGSIEACQKYGPLLLEKGSDLEARKDVIKNTIYASEHSGKDAPTSQWVKGEQWGQRLGIVVLALIAAVVFCALMLVIGFSALAAIMMTYLLLVAGVFFAALWIVPGKPREWGVSWGEALVGSVMVTFVGLLTFGVTLALLTALYTASAASGWFTSLGLSFTLLLVAFGFRKRLSEIVSAPGTGAGRAALVGALVTRGIARAVPQGARSAVSSVQSGVRGANTARKGITRTARSAGMGARRAGRAGTAQASRLARVNSVQAAQQFRDSRPPTRPANGPAQRAISEVNAARTKSAPARAAREAFVTAGGLRPGPRPSPRPSVASRPAVPPRRPAAPAGRAIATIQKQDAARHAAQPVGPRLPPARAAARALKREDKR
ncbi:hypothetical protein GQ603_16070 [Clavibacter michiganensis subsp. michiganensis]|uniref:hypothetical protein n=1 Tax=Clavibacter michiganensis TaxID=28447 RepID=UPI00142E0A44|nr:hypothetical protein [Clavibacter michiganensis]NIY62047.1 hypothetical protein [Clavibacter michiganensis subsp. michiganensis]QIT13109.1 hypothetical protein GRD74_15900 [Clavibacter michiganensis subsp. michiganensis]